MLVPNAANAAEAIRVLGLSTRRPVAVLCPGAEFGPAKRWPTEHFVTLARRFLASGYAVWLIGSPNDRQRRTPSRRRCRTCVTHAVELTWHGDRPAGTSERVISNDSGLMHAAAAVGRPLVALFGSSSPDYTPPLSQLASIARINIVCSPCFQRECPLGHFKCMRELSPNVVYDLARAPR